MIYDALAMVLTLFFTWISCRIHYRIGLRGAIHSYRMKLHKSLIDLMDCHSERLAKIRTLVEWEAADRSFQNDKAVYENLIKTADKDYDMYSGILW